MSTYIESMKQSNTYLSNSINLTTEQNIHNNNSIYSKIENLKTQRDGMLKSFEDKLGKFEHDNIINIKTFWGEQKRINSIIYELDC
jgi:hypothetical protein